MKSTKLTRTLFAGMMTCSMALTAIAVPVFTGPTVTQAATTKETDQFTLNLHKFKFLSGELIENNGLETDKYKDLERLNDVEFEVWNITELFHHIKTAKGYTTDEAKDFIQDNWDNGVTIDKTLAVALDSITTGANGDKGVATTNLDRTTEIDGNKLKSIYLFVEKAGTSNDTMVSSRPFMFSMNKALSAKDTIDLYVKNHGVEKDLAVGGVELAEGDHSLEVGTKLDYQVSTPVPAGILDPDKGYTTLRFYDEMTAEGTELTDIDVYYEGSDGPVSVLEKLQQFGNWMDSNSDGWKPGHQHAGFDVTLDLSQEQEGLDDFLKEIAGKQLFFDYTMTITKDAIPYKNIGNKFYGQFTNKFGTDETFDDAPEVEIGGHRFEKLDSETKNGLDGAKFVIKNDAGLYARLLDKNGNEITSADGNYHPDQIKWDIKDKATTITSATSGSGESALKGNLAIYGLEAGTYQLVETAAPTGYEIATDETEFIIKKADESTPAVTKLEVLNDPNDGLLPITGGMGIVTFLAIGAVAMGGAVYLKKKKA